MQMDFPGALCMQSLVASDDSSAFWELAKMQIDFPTALCCHLLASGRACMSLVAPDDPSAFWELAKMQMDFLGSLCCHLLASGRACMSLVAPDDPSAFWELAKMQMYFPGSLCCHLLASGQACSLWWPQTTHLHFGSWPKCRWTFPQRCAVISWLQVGHACHCMSLVAPDDPSAFWEPAKMQMDFPGSLCCHLLASGRMQSLVAISLRTPDQRYLEKVRVGSALSTRWLPRCSDANYLHFYGWPKCR